MMNKVSWPYFDPDFHNLPERIYGPTCRVSIDNDSFEDCTVVKVDSVNKQGLLLEVVQILTDLNLTITKSYVSSDAGWFMDVFHVKDKQGNKLWDQNVINCIQQAIGTTRETSNPSQGTFKTYNHNTTNDLVEPGHRSNEHSTAIEMTGTDRPGLFSEISAALADLRCNIVEAHAWSHNARLACVAYISDQSTHTPIQDPARLASIQDHLTTVLRATTDDIHDGIGTHTNNDINLLGGEGTIVTLSTSVERRLHQLMHSVRDFDGPTRSTSTSSMGSVTGSDSEEEGGGRGRGRSTVVSIENCHERGYSIVSIECKDRPRLMFDSVCTLTDMQYVIFHASISSNDGIAFQEYFVRHINGCALSTQSDKDRVIKCLEAAIERRVCEGVKLKLQARNRVGLLSDITRVLRENGLTVVRADVTTKGEMAVNDLYVRDISGNEVDMEFVESVKREMDLIDLEVENDLSSSNSSSGRPSPPQERSSSGRLVSFGDVLKSQLERFSHNFIPIN